MTSRSDFDDICVCVCVCVFHFVLLRSDLAVFFTLRSIAMFHTLDVIMFVYSVIQIMINSTNSYCVRYCFFILYFLFALLSTNIN